MFSPPVTAMRKAAVAVDPTESRTLTVKVNVPAICGTPDITPEFGFKLSPTGNEPVATLHVYGGLPPTAMSVWL
jgi:hypothetical protein